ncbi:MAG: phosphatidylserine decarboxylase family protein [Chitinophagaceae bacterium]|nr:phosphatidylserine decarboxylase family protein [Anaerolineae bacterium]
MTFRLHREGRATLTLAAGVLLLVNLLLPRQLRLIGFALSLLIFSFFAQFFRNPPRTTPDCAKCVIAPADGTIVAIERVHEGEFFKDERLKVSIYMSALNVHVNRVPINGKVIYTRYHPGKYLVAFHPKASELNERNTIVIEASGGESILIRQIAGILARRIVSYLHEGDLVQTGEELGFIKFGSRCDVFLPLESIVKVNLDQKVVGGETILAEIEK